MYKADITHNLKKKHKIPYYILLDADLFGQFYIFEPSTLFQKRPYKR